MFLDVIKDVASVLQGFQIAVSICLNCCMYSVFRSRNKIRTVPVISEFWRIQIKSRVLPSRPAGTAMRHDYINPPDPHHP